MRHLAAIIVAGSCLAGCPGGTPVGSGPITLSPQVQGYYAQYRKLPSPGYFAVSRDGRHAGYS